MVPASARRSRSTRCRLRSSAWRRAGLAGFHSTGPPNSSLPSRLFQRPTGAPAKPFRSRNVVGRLARGVSIDAARAELLARWPSIQSATLPAMLPEPDREALFGQRLDVASLASGFSGLRTRYGTTLRVLLGL